MFTEFDVHFINLDLRIINLDIQICEQWLLLSSIYVCVESEASKQQLHAQLVQLLYYYNYQQYLMNSQLYVYTPIAIQDQCWVQCYFLFSIYVNNIASDIHSQLKLFADDCPVYCPINAPEDHKIFHHYLRIELSAWADVWQVKFNIKKCCILRVSILHSTSNLHIQCTAFLYKLLCSINIWEFYQITSCHGPPTSILFATRIIIYILGFIRTQKPPSLSTSLKAACLWNPNQQTSIHKLEILQHCVSSFILNKP